MKPGRVTTVAFYLPQFHQIPENDAWWGQGFTEWRNVERARPLFNGHDQPRRPDSRFGEYSLDSPATVAWQVELANGADVDAFCYYHYWFDGKRLLERPLDAYLASTLTMPFCICWANENWTRKWDGKAREVLLAQRYGPDTADEVFESFLPYLSDQRYLRLRGAAVLLVHRVDQIPAASEVATRWRRLAEANGVGPLHLVASELRAGTDPRRFGFDAVAEFPPTGDNTWRSALLRPPRGLSRGFRGRLMSYERLAARYMRRSPPPFPRHHGVMPRWDNTPRRLERATIYVGSSPATYARWLSHARHAEWELRRDDGLVFINAWNEWAEGAYLEPDKTTGQAYLDATRVGWSATNETSPSPMSGWPTFGWAQSLTQAAAASCRNNLLLWRPRR